MNELILVIDFNWLAISRLFSHEKLFLVDNPDHMKRAGEEAFSEMLARSIAGVTYKIPQLTGIVVVADGGSWRKDLPRPKQINEAKYKGNRSAKEELDWDRIWGCTEVFLDHLKSLGITVSRNFGIEGDDWAWYWSRKLNAEGKDVILWTADRDIQQLVQTYDRSVTLWWNDRMGLVLPEECEPDEDPLAYMINPPFQNATTMAMKNTIRKYKYIVPERIVVEKVLCGDSGDNIKSIARFEKNDRTYRFTEKDYEKAREDLHIQSVTDLHNRATEVANYIIGLKKFHNKSLTAEDLREMIEYNIKLVWIDESVLPETILSSMAQEEYKEFNIQSLKDNFRILLPSTSDDVLDLFNEIAN